MGRERGKGNGACRRGRWWAALLFRLWFVRPGLWKRWWGMAVFVVFVLWGSDSLVSWLAEWHLTYAWGGRRGFEWSA